MGCWAACGPDLTEWEISAVVKGAAQPSHSHTHAFTHTHTHTHKHTPHTQVELDLVLKEREICAVVKELQGLGF